MVISLVATASLDYFFTDPILSFAISGPLEAVDLACLLTISLLITSIQSASRAEARESRRQRGNMESLYRVSQELLGLTPPATAGPALVRPFLAASGVVAVCLFDGSALEWYSAGSCDVEFEARTRDCFISGKNSVFPDRDMVVHTLHSRERVLGAIGFQGLHDPKSMAPAMATLAIAALERAHAFHSATTAAAQAETEMLRSAILDALAHEFKTPLATILTAAGGLRVGGADVPEQSELAEMIETEASRLGELTTRLLRLARVDRERS